MLLKYTIHTHTHTHTHTHIHTHTHTHTHTQIKTPNIYPGNHVSVPSTVIVLCT